MGSVPDCVGWSEPFESGYQTTLTHPEQRRRRTESEDRRVSHLLGNDGEIHPKSFFELDAVGVPNRRTLTSPEEDGIGNRQLPEVEISPDRGSEFRDECGMRCLTSRDADRAVGTRPRIHLGQLPDADV